MEKVYVFDCSSNSKLHGFTFDKAGANLPKDECTGKWNFSKELSLAEGVANIALNKEKMIKEIEEKGYYIGKHEIVIKETVIK